MVLLDASSPSVAASSSVVVASLCEAPRKPGDTDPVSLTGRRLQRESKVPFVEIPISLIPAIAGKRWKKPSTSLLVSGSPPVIRTFDTPSSAADPNQAQSFFIVEDILTREPLLQFPRHAVSAALIAAIGNRDAQ